MNGVLTYSQGANTVYGSGKHLFSRWCLAGESGSRSAADFDVATIRCSAARLISQSHEWNGYD